MHYQSENEIEDLIRDFIEKKLPKEKWTHEAHLTAAIWHLHKYDFYESVCLMKSRIITHNLSVGGTNDSANGYHETITIFWMQVIYFYTNNNRSKSLLKLCNDFLSTELASKKLPAYFYDEEKLMSPKFRSIYMEPKKVLFDYGLLGKILRKEVAVS
jgi:hypothetical protein